MDMWTEATEATECVAAGTTRPDRGQAALLVVVTATVLLAAMAWGLAATGRTVVERTRARVVSAVPLTGAEKETLQTKLAERFGPDLEFEFAVDPSLIGGIHLRVGDQVIDGTVAGKLAAMREHLTA